MDDLLKKYGMHAAAKPEIFRLARNLRLDMTAEERLLWPYLYAKPNGRKFRRQHPFGPFILDFFCFSAKLSIEIDGYSHDTISQKKLDKKRTDYIESYGITEIRFSNNQVIENVEEVLASIYFYL